MNDKKFLQKIKEDAESITPPASLQPDAIEQKLRQAQAHTATKIHKQQCQDVIAESQAQEHTAANNNAGTAAFISESKNTADSSKGPAAEPYIPQKVAHKNKKKTKIYRHVLRYGSLAAVFALALLVAFRSEKLVPQEDHSASGNIVSETQAPPSNSGNTTSETQADSSDSGNIVSETQPELAASDTAAYERGTEPSLNSLAVSDAFAQNIPSSLEDVYNILYDEFYYTEEEFYPGLGARLYGANDILYAQEEVAMENYASGNSATSDSTDTSAFSGSFENGTANTDTITSSSASSTDTGSSDGSLSDSYYESADTAANESTDYSKTNTQELNVDEGDIIKTDGQYIYILREDLTLAIVEANSGSPQLVSLTDLLQKNSGAVQEMYLDGDALHIILTEISTELVNGEDTYYTQTSRQTVLLSYNIADRTNPSLVGEVTQDGSYSDSRKNGQYIYLFTRYIPDICETYAESTVAPLINGVAADASDFYLPDTITDNAYLVISSVDTNVPDEIFDSKILVSGTTNFYVSQNNIYIANENYSQEQLITELTKFHYEDGMITGIAAASVKGYLNNSFSLNEYDGYLRVVSTYSNENWEEENGLFIFDENLTQISSIENLAEGETIRSARFFGDTGYFVTFRQTDPLFSADLSDPENPQILGELKISGFSSYLHFYGENQLLGIGYEADEETGQTTGIKLSMFNISDPANVTETSRYVIENITWCPAIEDYKAILVHPEKNLIGFYCDNRYLVFSYDTENGFTQELVYDFFTDNLTGQADYYNMRGLYIEDTFYLAGNTFIVTFDMENSFEKQSILPIQ